MRQKKVSGGLVELWQRLRSGGADEEDEWEFPDDADAEDEEDDEEEERVTGEELAQLQQDAEHIQEVTDARKGAVKKPFQKPRMTKTRTRAHGQDARSPKRSFGSYSPTKSLPSTCSLRRPQ